MRMWMALMAAPVVVSLIGAESALAAGKLRKVAPAETWEIKDGRFYRNGQWVFLRTGKLLRGFDDPQAADQAIADIDVLIDRLNYNNFSINIYPDTFDADADGRVDPPRMKAYANVGRIMDHCWKRGVFCCLSIETYNVGGGGTPVALFKKSPECVAVNALGERARDVEYGGSDGKWIPSVFHPAYLHWSHGFIQNFLRGLGKQRVSRVLYIETTVEPQYLGRCSAGDKDQRRAFLDFNPAAAAAFAKWQKSFPADDPRHQLTWPTTTAEREKLVGNKLFNEFRGQGLGGWITGDIQAIRSVVPDAWVAVDYNGRFDDPKNLRMGDRDVFLTAIDGAQIIQVSPHAVGWSTMSWDDVIRVNKNAKKHWALTEHMTMTGNWNPDDQMVTADLDNTLAKGTRWGWEFVNVGNGHASDDFQVYSKDWKSAVLDVIEGEHWADWLKKIGAEPFVPKARELSTRAGS